jgi:NAD(P)-dependent dehydrogenase (short-subunit alcohol dehydrogenase family)
MTSSTSLKTVLIVGASRGLGLGLAGEYLRRGWRVIATVRQAGADSPLQQAGAGASGRLEIESVDINEPGQVAALRRKLAGRSIDVLMVNAGVMNQRDEQIGAVATEEFNRVMVTNALSPMRVVELFADLVPAGGVVAVMSSGLASVANNLTGGTEVYRASKAALNTLMRSYASRSTAVPRRLVAMAPGWVRTDMGGAAAPLDVATSVRGMVDVLDAQAGRTGMAFLNYLGETVNW